MYAFTELFVLVAFAVGWLVIEYVCHRLDREKDARERKARSREAPGTTRASE